MRDGLFDSRELLLRLRVVSKQSITSYRVCDTYILSRSPTGGAGIVSAASTTSTASLAVGRIFGARRHRDSRRWVHRGEEVRMRESCLWKGGGVVDTASGAHIVHEDLMSRGRGWLAADWPADPRACGRRDWIKLLSLGYTILFRSSSCIDPRAVHYYQRSNMQPGGVVASQRTGGAYRQQD